MVITLLYRLLGYLNLNYKITLTFNKATGEMSDREMRPVGSFYSGTSYRFSFFLTHLSDSTWTLWSLECSITQWVLLLQEKSSLCTCPLIWEPCQHRGESPLQNCWLWLVLISLIGTFYREHSCWVIICCVKAFLHLDDVAVEKIVTFLPPVHLSTCSPHFKKPCQPSEREPCPWTDGFFRAKLWIFNLTSQDCAVF